MEINRKKGKEPEIKEKKYKCSPQRCLSSCLLYFIRSLTNTPNSVCAEVKYPILSQITPSSLSPFLVSDGI